MNDKIACPVCIDKGASNEAPFSIYKNTKINCDKCGVFSITQEALMFLNNKTLSPRQIANITGWLYENKDYVISERNIVRLLNIKTPSFHEKADKLMLHIEKMTNFAGESIDCTLFDKKIVWGLNLDEVEELFLYLITCERIKYTPTGGRMVGNTKKIKILPKGWEYIESLKQINADSEQGFVAMWFDDSMQQIYETVISEAILDAGYKPHRVDLREHNSKIDDEIIAQIRKSRFVLSDFTGHRGGVYYEAGFAHGLGLETFFSCKADDMENLHFDIRQYNCIVWEKDKPEEFKKKITNRIESVLGQGTYNRS